MSFTFTCQAWVTKMVEQETRQLLIRAPGKLFDQIDAWRRKQPDIPGRAEAVRRLLAKALESEAPKKAKKRENIRHKTATARQKRSRGKGDFTWRF